ncbi:MAG: hypothetical protein ABI760_10265 [Ferruginibacter sp.]
MIKFINKIKSIKNPFILFSPFLLFYITYILISPTQGTKGDEGRYLEFANNLIHGFYSTPPPDINLWNGPGYPVLLMPFVALHLPLICMSLMNGVLYYLSVILLFKTLRQFVSLNKAVVFSLFWACYYISFEEMNYILPEVFTSFLISLLLFNLVRSFDSGNKSKRNAIYSGLIMGFIVLTKVIFGYVILCMFIGIGIGWVVNRRLFNYKRGILIMLISLGTILPYLVYTWHLTDKIYYLSNSGGMSLYWMSSPDENEVGDWYHARVVRQTDTLNSGIDVDTKLIPGWNNYLYSKHSKDIQEINKYTGVERDNAYKKIAINNIKRYPLKYLKNCISNCERLFFGFPYSYRVQRYNLRMPLNMFVVVSMFFSMVVTIINWRKIFFPLRFLLFFIFLYLSLSLLVSTYIRMFTVIQPALLFWIAFIFQKSIKLNLFFDKE